MRKGKIEFENGSNTFIPKEEHNKGLKPLEEKLKRDTLRDFSNEDILKELFRRVGDKKVMLMKRTEKEFDKFFKWIEGSVKLGNEILDSFWYIYDQGKVQGLELYCPHCGWNKKTGGTTFKGLLIHACDPGCCCTICCSKCGRVYGLQEDEKQTMNKDGMLTSKKKKGK